MVAKKKKLFNLLLHNVIPFCACNHLFIDRLLNTLVWFLYDHKTNEKHKAILQGAKRIHRSAMRQCNKAQSIQPERRRTITYMEEGTT